MKDKGTLLERRQALKIIGIAGMSSFIANHAFAKAEPNPPLKPAKNKSSGYQETDHIRQYYALLRQQ